MKIKKMFRDWCPPIFLKWARAMRGSEGLLFSGDYASWSEAQKNSSGYDAEQVFQKVSDAALRVKRGEALFERDSVCFYEADFRWPVLACLLSASATHDGKLNVLDFGGSLGSFYLQHKKFFSKLKQVNWAVVEQEHFVTFGQSHIQETSLRFYESVASCLKHQPVDIVFLSSVLQYLETPMSLLTLLAKVDASYILIDRTPFIVSSRDRLMVQKVPKEIYDASYPAWFFSEKNFMETMKKLNYRLLAEFSCAESSNEGQYRGMFFERI